jgi:tetratricopeptide (TPR) repeat protein
LTVVLAFQGSVAASLVAERSAFADAPDAKSAAQRKAKEGQRLAESGQQAEALSRFKEAYEANPEPGYLYNMGLAYEALGRDVQALDAFERFLRDVQNIPPEFVADANRHQRELRSKVGELDIRCPQTGARVEVDEVAIGATPLDAPIRLKSGSHHVAVSKAGFDTFTATLDIAGADTVHLTASMRQHSSGPPPSSASAAPESASTSRSQRDRAAASASQAELNQPPSFSIYAGVGAGFWRCSAPRPATYEARWQPSKSAPVWG